jgi:L-alanine-DL-glutamate epimerase-like enolase superfamily enzyme
MAFFRKVEQYGIYWYEEPVHSTTCLNSKNLQALPGPVSMGESLANRYFFKSYADAGWDSFRATPAHGLDDWCAVRDMAYERGIWF